MENKYYTPEISEFYPGFEYELLGYSGKMVPGGITQKWEKLEYSLDASYLNDEDSLKELLDCEEIRVKYLDQSDIEELGFTVVKTKGNSFEAIKKFNFTYEDCTTEGEYNIIVGGDKYCVIKLKDIGETTLFRGEIKNKNVLKQVFKMLDIK